MNTDLIINISIFTTFTLGFSLFFLWCYRTEKRRELQRKKRNEEWKEVMRKFNQRFG